MLHVQVHDLPLLQQEGLSHARLSMLRTVTNIVFCFTHAAHADAVAVACLSAGT